MCETESEREREREREREKREREEGRFGVDYDSIIIHLH